MRPAAPVDWASPPDEVPDAPALPEARGPPVAVGTVEFPFELEPELVG